MNPKTLLNNNNHHTIRVLALNSSEVKGQGGDILTLVLALGPGITLLFTLRHKAKK